MKVIPVVLAVVIRDVKDVDWSMKIGHKLKAEE